MKRFLFSLIVIMGSIGLHAEILDPKDPKFAWMDEIVEREFVFYKKKGITRKMLDQTQKTDSTFLRFKVVQSKMYGPKLGARSIQKTALADLPRYFKKVSRVVVNY